MNSARLMAIAALATSVPAVAGGQTGTGWDDPRRALVWFTEQRAFPFTAIPAGARARALSYAESRWPRLAFQSRGLGNSIVASTWTSLGPAPIIKGNVSGAFDATGRINTIAVDPNDSQIIYLGGATGGVWKSVDGGTTWTPLTDSQCGLAMGSIAIDPVNSQIVYAGTGEANFSGDSYQGCGVLRSTDGGATWTQQGASAFVAPSGGSTSISKVIIVANAGTTSATVVIVAASNGLWRSTDSGATWTKVRSIVATDVIADPAVPTVLYAAGGHPSGTVSNGVYKSSDGGVNWTQLAGGLPTASVGRISLAISPTAPRTVYASIQSTATSQLLGIWASGDGGTSWTKLNATGASCASQCWYDMAIAVHPTDPNTVYFSGFGFYRSTNAGSTFSSVGNAIHVDQHAVTFDPKNPSVVFAGNDGGIYKSIDGGTTWTGLNTNLALTQFYPGIAVHPAGTTIIGGTQDNGTAEYDGSTSGWASRQGGDGAYSAYDRAGTTTYAGFTSGSFPNCRIIRRDAPGTFPIQCKVSGIALSDRSNWVSPMVMDPTSSNVLYYGTHRVYRSTNRGDFWTAISPDVTNGGALNTIAVAPSDSQTIYTGASDGTVFVTSDLGATWTRATTGLPQRSISRIIVDAIDPRTAWLVTSGYLTGHVFVTRNRGNSWSDISFDLPDIPVNAIVRQRGSHEIDIGTDLGVFALQEGAATWTRTGTGLPNTVVSDLAYDGPRGRLIAATHGRGMFALQVTSEVLRGNITDSQTLSALDAQVILAAVVNMPLPAGAKRFPHGDANCDGDVTAVDALLVLSKLVGLNTGSACVGTVK